MVNSAGAIVVTPFGRLKREHWQKTLAVNLGAVIDSCQAALPHLRATVATEPRRQVERGDRERALLQPGVRATGSPPRSINWPKATPPEVGTPPTRTALPAADTT